MMLVALGLVATTLVINEVCYDPAGADDGAEYVELWNAGPDTLRLAGLALEFANGADDPPAWRAQWRADGTVVMAPAAPFLVVDRGWSGEPGDAEASLNLQNGPDALRLVADGSVLDLVGWGDLADADLSEGRPAPDVTGEVIARRPDGHDTDDNAADFVAAAATPGRPNWRMFAPAVTTVAWQPPSLERAGESCVATVEVANEGLAALVGAHLELRGPATAAVALPVVPAGGAVAVTLTLAPPHPGNWPVTATVMAAGVRDTMRQAVGRLQVGRPSLHLGEVMAAPLAGGEWCEVVNRDSVPRSLEGLALRDEDGSWRALPAADLAPGDCQLIAQDPPRLAGWLDELTAAGHGPACLVASPLSCASWPSLNNTAPASRTFADRLHLGDADGNVLDHVTLGAGDGRAPDGRSLERGADGRWRPATAVAGATPGCAGPAAAAVAAGALRIAPNPFDPDSGDGAVRLQFRLPAAMAGWEMRVYDLWGQHVRDVGGDDLGGGWREAVWDGRDGDGRPVPDGGYVVLLCWRTAAGGVQTAHRRLVVVRREAS